MGKTGNKVTQHIFFTFVTGALLMLNHKLAVEYKLLTLNLDTWLGSHSVYMCGLAVVPNRKTEVNLQIMCLKESVFVLKKNVDVIK